MLKMEINLKFKLQLKMMCKKYNNHKKQQLAKFHKQKSQLNMYTRY